MRSARSGSFLTGVGSRDQEVLARGSSPRISPRPRGSPAAIPGHQGKGPDQRNIHFAGPSHKRARGRRWTVGGGCLGPGTPALFLLSQRHGGVQRLLGQGRRYFQSGSGVRSAGLVLTVWFGAGYLPPPSLPPLHPADGVQTLRILLLQGRRIRGAPILLRRVRPLGLHHPDDEVILNFRLNWIPRPGSDLFLVINQQAETWESRWNPTQTTVLTKLVWRLAF